MKTHVVTTNQEQELYVIPCGGGYSCLGFDVCIDWSNRLADELGLPRPIAERGTLDAYRAYQALISEASKRNVATGWRSKSELTPQLIGLEGKRVEVVDCYGERRQFYVGKSMGFIPCHLEIARRNCHGGGAVTGAPFKSVRVLC
jgi:hypothetical protein